MKKQLEKPGYPTPEQIQEWKASPLGVEHVSVDDLNDWFRRPDKREMKLAIKQMQISETAFAATLMETCHLAGDRGWTLDDETFFAYESKVTELIGLKDYELETVPEGVKVVIEGCHCILKRPTRVQVEQAQQRNKKKQPFATNELLLEWLWVSGDERMKNDTRYLFPLFSAIEDAKTSKLAVLKKS